MIVNVFKSCKVTVVSCAAKDEKIQMTFFPRSTWTVKDFKTVLFELTENMEEDWDIFVETEDLKFADTIVICVEDHETKEVLVRLEVKLKYNMSTRLQIASDITGIKF